MIEILPVNPFKSVLVRNSKQIAKRLVDDLMTRTATDDVLLLEAYLGGLVNWRIVFQKELGPLFAKNQADCDVLAERMYKVLGMLVKQKWPHEDPKAVYESIEVISPPTQDEIEEATEVEIASSDELMAQMYEGSRRTRKGKDLGVKTVDGKDPFASDRAD